MSFTNDFTLSIEFKEILTVFIGTYLLGFVLFYIYLSFKNEKSQE